MQAKPLQGAESGQRRWNGSGIYQYTATYFHRSLHNFHCVARKSEQIGVGLPWTSLTS